MNISKNVSQNAFSFFVSFVLVFCLFLVWPWKEINGRLKCISQRLN